MNEIIHYTPKDRMLLIDGDVIIHMACWQKPISKFQEKELKEQGVSKTEIEALKQTYQPSIEKAQDRFEHFMEHIFESHFKEEKDTRYAIAIGDSQNNFRLDLYPDYKKQKSRKAAIKKRAPYIQDLRMWAVDEFGAHYCQGYESDDAIGSWASKFEFRDNYIIVSVDKDLNLIPGHHFDPKTEDNSKKRWYVSKNEAEMFFWKQMLMGDSIDNIPGIKGIGPIKAEKLLSGCETPEECKEVVVSEYDLKYGAEGYNKLLFNGQLLHIWRCKGDIWNFDKKEYKKITGTKPITKEK